MANPQTLEILLRIKAETDKALKQLKSDMKDVREETQKVATSFSGLSGKSFEFNQITDAAKSVLGVVKGMAGAFVDLAQRGGQVASVATSFSALAASVNTTGAALLGAVRTGTKGLVADFDIMLASNRAVMLGLPVTAQSMGVLSSAALALGKSMGMTTTKALDDLITGLGRGSAQILDNVGITVTAEDAFAKYAATIGKSAEALTEGEKKMAVYNAAVTAAQVTMGKLGDVQLTFADRMTQIKVSVDNFRDSLGMAIAQSPVLNAGLSTVADSMQKAFGANQQQTVQAIVRAVNEAAIALVAAARVGVQAGFYISEAFNGAKLMLSQFIIGITHIVGQALGAMQSIYGAASRLPGVLGATFKASADDVGALADKVALVKAQQIDYAKALATTSSANEDARTKAVNFLNTVQSGMEAARGKIVAVAAAAGTVPPAIAAAGQAIAMDAEKRAEALRLIAKAAAEQREKWLEAEAVKAGEIAREIVRIEEQKQAEITAAHANAARSRMEMEQAVAEALVRNAVAMWEGFGNGAREAIEILELLGISGESAFGQIANAAAQTADMLARSAQQGYISWADLGKQIVTTFKNGSAAGGAMSGAMTGFAIGGPIGAGIGAIAGGILGWAGGAKKAQEEMRKLRSEFIQSAGGMEALRAKAQQAGVNIDQMFKAKSASQLAHMIDTIKAKLQTWDDAHEKLNAAIEKYGFTLEELGPKFQAQRLDEMAQGLLQDWTLLVASGIDVANVATRMADSLNEMAAKARATGQSLPENLRPIYEELLRQGKLVDENGNAYGSLEEAGLSFTQSLTDSMQDLVIEIQKMVAALTGIRVPPIRIGVEYDIPGAPPGGGHPPREEEVGFAGGGIGDFGSGTPVTLHNREGILPLSDSRAMAELGAHIAAAIQRSGGLGGGGFNVSLQLGQRQLGQASGTLSRRRISRTSPAGIRR
jgi:hypothetical protein